MVRQQTGGAFRLTAKRIKSVWFACVECQRAKRAEDPLGTAPLTILPVRLALFDQRAQTFLRILELVELVEKNIHRLFQSVAQRHSHPAKDRFLRHAQHGTCVSGDSRDQIADRSFKISLRHQPVDQTEFQSTLRVDRLAGQNNFKRRLGTNQVRKYRRGQRGEHTDRYFGLGKTRLRRCDDEIAEEREFRSSTDRRTIYDAQNRFAHFQHRGECAVKRVEHLKYALRSVLTDVHAAREDLARRIHHDELGGFILTGGEDRVGDFTEHTFVEEIVVGPRQREAGYVVVKSELYVLKLRRVAAHDLCARSEDSGRGAAALDHEASERIAARCRQDAELGRNRC